HSTLYFIPIGNPDGYEYNMPNGGMHRKNMNFTLGNGVDLNRNWGYMWGYDNVGSSPSPTSETYRGTAPFSEPETQVQSNFIIDKAPIAAMSYHTYGGDLLYPWGYEDIFTPDNDLFVGWADQMTAVNNYTYGTPWQVMYNSNGDQLDWSYCGVDVPKVYCMTPEVGDNGFWGSQNDTSEIVRICDECRPMNIMFCMFALNFVGIGEEGGGIGVEPLLDLGSVQPNPVVTSAVFRISAPSSSVLDVVIYDTSGRAVQTFEAGSPEGGQLDLTWIVPDNIPAGVYTVTVSDGAGSIDSGRFTVLR
ncbi:MAG: T9SS type A sorting domain-containing protein, partial [Candidatus Fermentibacteraceae bacterium]|nr:T9SS type A sorting domain-containing protein [Candidatus Fermentibacteraceae bacterium]